MMKGFDPKNSVWTEKYRPGNLDDVVLDDGIRNKIRKYLENPMSLPHFLFYSKTAGTGKTTVAKCIINELGCDSLVINSSDDRKIEVIREKVKEFSYTKSSRKDMKRCVFLDEVDGMLKPSQNALRNIMETYADNVFFILTCNDINKVIEPLQSRCAGKIFFTRPDKEKIYQYVENICRQEGMQYDEEGLKELVRLNYPSIRDCVTKLQDLHMSGKTLSKDTAQPYTSFYDELYNMLIEQKNWKKVKENILSGSIDPRLFNKHIWEKEIEKDDTNLRLVQICCRNERDICLGADSKVIVVTSLPEMIR